MSFVKDNIKFLRKKNELTQNGFAERIGVKRPVVGAYEEGRAEPKLTTLKRISETFNVSVDALISEDLSKLSEDELANRGIDIKGAKLRVLAVTVDDDENENVEFVPQKASAGYTNGYADTEYVQELPRIHMPMLSGGTYRAFEIKGDSMLPLQPGSIIIGQYVDNWHDIKNGKTYVVVTSSEGVVYKRVYNKIYDGGHLELHSDNKDYISYEVPLEDVLEIWEASMYISRDFPDPKEETASLSSSEMSKLLLSLQKEVQDLKGKTE